MIEPEMTQAIEKVRARTLSDSRGNPPAVSLFSATTIGPTPENANVPGFLNVSACTGDGGSGTVCEISGTSTGTLAGTSSAIVTGTSSTPAASRYKTELCRPFVELGKCRYGDKCQFAHGVDDLRSVERHPKHKTELCRSFHTTGLCPYGSRCHFIHNETKPPAPQPLVATDLTSGLAGILAAAAAAHAPSQQVMVTFGSLTSHSTTSLQSGLALDRGMTGTLDPGVTSAALSLPASHDAALLPVTASGLHAGISALPTPPRSILPLEIQLGSIVQRRRQLRGSVDFPSECSMSGSSLSSGSSSSSSPISSFLDETFSPPPASSVFSPLIGQYMSHGDLLKADSSMAALMMSNCNNIQESLQPAVQLSQVMPVFEFGAIERQMTSVENMLLALNANVAMPKNLESGIREPNPGSFANGTSSNIFVPNRCFLPSDLQNINGQ